jgi:hypothetical protein
VHASDATGAGLSTGVHAATLGRKGEEMKLLGRRIRWEWFLVIHSLAHYRMSRAFYRDSAAQ